MRTCPHCGSELHDDSTFCFACMSIVNERKELLIKVNTSRKRTIPMVCVAVAIIVASSVFAVVSKKNNAVETKTPEPAKAVTTSATVTTIPQTTTAATTTVPTTTTAPAPTADEIDKISGGIRQASTGTAGTTTTAAALPVEQKVIQVQPEEQNDYQPNEAQQEENTAPAEPEPSYFSEDGANELSRIFADKINKKREGRGYAPLRVCGQLDSLLSISLETLTYVESEGEIDTCNEITLDKLKSNLSDVGLPSDSEFIRVSYVMNCCKSYDEVFEYAKKVNFSNELFTDDEGDLTVYSQRLDYKYLGCAIYDMCRSQLKPNGDYSSSSEYVCEIWLMK